MINVKRPQKGQRTLQSMFDSLNSIIDYLPTLTVRGDNYSTYVEHSNGGTIIHSKQNTSPDQAGGKTYYAGSGLTLSGNTFNNALTSGRFIEITTGNAINCTLTGGNDIQITPAGVINYTGSGGGGGGGGGSTYYADGYTLSTTSQSGNVFCMYDVLPLLTGGGGITVAAYGDAPLYPGHALGTIISCPYYVGSGGIGILDDTTEGTYIKYISITGDVLTESYFDFINGLSSYSIYDVNNNVIGKNVGIVQGYRNDLNTITGRPSTGNYILSSSGGTLSWAENSGGGGTPQDPPTAYFADNFTLSTTTENGTTFCLYDVYPLLTGGGGITVSQYGDAPLYPYNAKGTIISCPVYLPSTGIAIVDDSTEGTYNKYIGITGSFLDSSYYNFTNGISSYYVYDASNNVIGENVGIVEAYRNDLNVLTGRPSTGNKILSSHAGTMSWEDPPNYTPSDPPTAYYADNITLSTVNGDGTTFFLLDVYPLLTGGGGTTVSYYGDAPGYLGASGTIISTPVYLPSTGIAIVDDETEGSYNKYIYVSGNYLDSSYYNFTNGLSTYNVLDANNNVIGQNVGLVETYQTILNTLSSSTANANHNKVLSSSSNGTISWETNNSNVPTPVANTVLSTNSQGTMQWTANTGGGGGGGGGGGNSAWPMWENLCGSGHLVYVQQWYTTSTGGWLRISNPQGGSFGGCNSIYIDPVVPPDGVEGQNHIGLGNGNISFFLPIPPGSSFWIGLNQDGTQCWFDGTTSPATHTSTDQSTMNELRGYAENASSMFYSGYDSVTATFERASGVFDSASSRWESYYPDNLDQSDKDYFYDQWNEISGYADSLTSYAEGLEELNNQAEAIYANMSTEEGLKYVTSTNNFYLSTSTWATSAVNWAVQTKYYYDNCPTQ